VKGLSAAREGLGYVGSSLGGYFGWGSKPKAEVKEPVVEDQGEKPPLELE
jgi:hypothetical protein